MTALIGSRFFSVVGGNRTRKALHSPSYPFDAETAYPGTVESGNPATSARFPDAQTDCRRQNPGTDVASRSCENRQRGKNSEATRRAGATRAAKCVIAKWGGQPDDAEQTVNGKTSQKFGVGNSRECSESGTAPCATAGRTAAENSGGRRKDGGAARSTDRSESPMGSRTARTTETADAQRMFGESDSGCCGKTGTNPCRTLATAKCAIRGGRRLLKVSDSTGLLTNNLCYRYRSVAMRLRRAQADCLRASDDRLRSARAPPDTYTHI
jgi:hypothetical protein